MRSFTDKVKTDQPSGGQVEGEHPGQQDAQYQPDRFSGMCKTAGRWPHFSLVPCTEED
ncbi:MAG TPA: hypothetical protein VGR96_08665 [Acidobacteriaceae bacterium]|nr:hypothetical protein [Acidobacteriaceae bacterium]